MSKKRRYVSRAEKVEFHREMISTFIYPALLAAVFVIFLKLSLIQEDFEKLFSVWVLISMIAGILSLIVSYLIITRKHRKGG